MATILEKIVINTPYMERRINCLCIGALILIQLCMADMFGFAQSAVFAFAVGAIFFNPYLKAIAWVHKAKGI